MSVTLANLIDAVNDELENHAMRGSSESEGDGETTAFIVPPVGTTIIDDAKWSVYVDGVGTTDFTMDFDSGVCTFNGAPADGAVLLFIYNYVFWTDGLVTQAINAAIDNLFPALYVSTAYTITSDGTSYEYAMPIGPDNARKTITAFTVANPTTVICASHGFSSGTIVTISGSDSTPSADGDYEVTSISTNTFSIPINVTVAGTTGTASRPPSTQFITAIDQRASATDPWKRLRRAKRYEVFHDEGTITARFYTAPSSGFLRAHCICRPTTLTASTDSIETVSGLPTRAKDAIISYACWYLLGQKLAPRVRSDMAVTTQNSGALLPSQMNYAGQSYLMRFQFQLASLRMPPWSMT
jgi:hypothetical protein